MMRSSPRTTLLVLAALFSGAGALAFTRISGWWPRTAEARDSGQPSTDHSLVRALAAASHARPFQLAAGSQVYRDGSYTGPAVDAYYGFLRVRVDVQGGRITAIHVLQYPAHSRTSRRINSEALPMLESEVIQAQSVFVYMISGATLSSNAFLRSTYFALRNAHA